MANPKYSKILRIRSLQRSFADWNQALDWGALSNSSSSERRILRAESVDRMRCQEQIPAPIPGPVLKWQKSSWLLLFSSGCCLSGRVIPSLPQWTPGERASFTGSGSVQWPPGLFHQDTVCNLCHSHSASDSSHAWEKCERQEELQGNWGFVKDQPIAACHYLRSAQCVFQCSAVPLCVCNYT